MSDLPGEKDGAFYPAQLMVGVYEVALEALEPIELNAFAGATLRGAFGWAFKQMVCYQPQVRTCQGCLLRAQCPFPQVFEAGTLHAAQQNVPAPYVLRAPTGGQRRFEAGQRLAFQIVLVGRAIGLLPYFAVALGQLQRRGIGRLEGRARVAAITALHPDGVTTTQLFDGATPDELQSHRGWPARAWVGERPAPARVAVEFLTPARLKADERVWTTPAFHVLYRALLRRAGALCEYHGETPWETDYVGLTAQAHAVELVTAETTDAWRSRYSGRQGQIVAVRGCVGRVVYEGALAPFWPLLQLGEVIHVGKNTTFGLGQYRLAEA